MWNLISNLISKDIKLFSPMIGQAIKIEEVPDKMFAQKMLGDGVAINPTIGQIKAPADGLITMIAETKHAIGLIVDDVEILIHVGIDTVKLNGKYFEVKVNQDTKVKRGDLLLTFDIDSIEAEGYSLITPIVITNGKKIKSIHYGDINFGDDLINVVK